MTCRLISTSNIRKNPTHKYRSIPDSRSNSETRSWRRRQENKTVSQAMVTYGQSPQIHRCKQTPKRRRRDPYDSPNPFKSRCSQMLSSHYSVEKWVLDASIAHSYGMRIEIF